MTQPCYSHPVIWQACWSGFPSATGWDMEQMMVYRVELERLDHGYEARVPEIHGFLCEGLTEGETLTSVRRKLDLHREQTGVATGKMRVEVFRT